MAKPKVTVNAVANQYTGPTERIIEFSDHQVSDDPAGGLIAFRRCERPDGNHRLMVQIYRCEADVDVIVGKPEWDDTTSIDAHRTAVALAEEGLRRLLLFTAEESTEYGELQIGAGAVAEIKRRVQRAVDEEWLATR